MKNLLLGGLLAACLIHMPAARAALKEGDAAPAFSAPAALAGQPFDYSLADALKKGPVVVYFYPGAFTAGCNIQAHSFAVEHARFAAAGASLIGVSFDNIGKLREFSADPNFCAGQFAVASDADGRIARAYQLSVREAVAGRQDTRGLEIDNASVERTTFVVTPQGRIAAVVGGVSPGANVQKALEAVQKLNAAAAR
jgi:thioredoxin-dependent peroxiredoxin